MSDLEVPRWLIRKLVYRGGFRLDKRTKFDDNDKKTLIPMGGPVCELQYTGYSKRAEPVVSERHKLVLDDSNMNFANWEYRFWGVEVRRDKPVMATCRFCQTMQYSGPARKKHLKEKKCTTKLIKVYSLLLKDSKCVICDKYTMNDKFGVPLCEKGLCLDMWMHDEACPTALENAILFADRQGLIGDATE